MKKVLLNKSQNVRMASAPVDLRQKQQSVPTVPPAMVKVMPTEVITNTYMQRKSFQSIYEDIFKLLMRLPDKALQQRVIDAINGTNSSNQCKQCSLKCNQPITKVNSATQTYATDVLDLRARNSSGVLKITRPEQLEKQARETDTNNANQMAADKQQAPRKRGRKRNNCVPKVVKRSAAEMAQQEREEKQLTPVTKKKKKNNTAEAQPVDPCKAESERRISIESSISLNIDDVFNDVDSFIKDDKSTTIMNIVEKEFYKSIKMSEEGLLPIHDAILCGDVYGLKLQLFVWQKLRHEVDLNDLLTCDREDCLQLAVINNCEPEIVKIVLDAGLHPNLIYEETNNIIHIAVLNHINLDSLRELMRKIDLNLLLQTDDDGYTALHLAVRNNQYKIAEVIMDGIDERIHGKPIYNRNDEELQPQLESNTISQNKSNTKSVELTDEKKFAKYYEQACDSLAGNIRLLNQPLKQELLDAAEARGGNVALFYAIEAEQEHFCYFLLAHLANPDLENLSGHTPKSFHYEYARSLRISLKISRVMDKVLKIIYGALK